jgi:hypothetical protein
MKHTPIMLIAAVVVIVMTSCNNQAKQPEAKKASSLQPYNAVLVQHTVKDYAAWLPGFTANDSMRKAAGLTQPGVGRGLEDSNMVVVFLTASDIQKAKDFASSPQLKEAMDKDGVTGTPVISYINVLFDDTSTIPQHDRLMVTHHVKDFDTWKKAFDAEGDDARATNGLVERALARGIDDPNTVTLLFAVTDMAKAKARVTSTELKKIMTDAGVDGPPQITWFTGVINELTRR